MTPVLVTSNDARGVVLVVQMPSTVRIDEHAIGIVHEVLGKPLSATRMKHLHPVVGVFHTCGGL